MIFPRTNFAATRRRFFAGMLLWSATAVAVQAGDIYKSVDANGNVVYSDHLNPTLSQTTVVQVDEPSLPPRELHFCWTNCFTLILDKGAYRRADGTDESWTVETFSPQAIVLHRHDAARDGSGHSRDVIYAGQVANDRLINVTVNGQPVSGIDASWGSALNTLPGSNAERDATNISSSTSSGATVSSASAPPPLPEEDQTPLSEDGFLWTPGYWYWRDHGYFWVPGAWVRPPRVGYLWTPGYWDSAGAVFIFHTGHWGPTVGFYGGVNYGYGYFGNGYSGGHWVGNTFAYNSAVNHVNPAVAHHVYTEPVVDDGTRYREVSKGGSTYSVAQRSGDAMNTVPPHPVTPHPVPPVQSLPHHQSAPQALQSGAAAGQRTNPTASTTVKTPAPPSPPRLNHITPSRPSPTKQ